MARRKIRQNYQMQERKKTKILNSTKANMETTLGGKEDIMGVIVEEMEQYVHKLNMHGGIMLYSACVSSKNDILWQNK